MADEPTTPAATPEPGPEGTPSPEPTTPAFHETLQDSALQEWAKNKGWQDADAAVKSAYNAEKLIGAPADELVRIPENFDDTVARNVLSKLGLPEKPDGYELHTLEGMQPDEAFQNWAKENFHKRGLTKAQALGVSQDYNEYVAQQLEAKAEEYKTQVAADEAALKKELGNGYDRKIAGARKAAEALGFDGELVDALEESAGFGKTMKLLIGLSEKMGEDKFVDGEVQRTGFHSQMTPEEAKNAYASMVNDPEQMKALMDKQHPNHKTMMERKATLFSIMYPEG